MQSVGEIVVDRLRIEADGVSAVDAEIYARALASELQRQPVDLGVPRSDHETEVPQITIAPLSGAAPTTADAWAVGAARQIVQGLIDACGICGPRSGMNAASREP